MDDFQTEIVNIIHQIEDKVEQDLILPPVSTLFPQHNIIENIENSIPISNDQLNSKFQKLLEDDSSADSSSSSPSSDTDSELDENNNSFRKLKAKIIQKKDALKNALESESDADLDDEEDGTPRNKNNQNQIKYVKTKNEITLDELGPAECVDITLDESIKMERIGQIISKVDKLVVIQSVRPSELEDTRPLDEETILFDSTRKSLGKIFEIFGPVTSPFYSIRFNDLSKEIEIRKLDMEIGSYIYYVPDSGQYTKFIFNIDELRKIKGSDASWSHDNEPPVECLDYSDDEKEKKAKRALKQKNKKLVEDYSGSEGEEDEEDNENSTKSPTKSQNFRNNQNFNKSQSNKNFNSNSNNNVNRGGKRAFNSQIPKSQTFSAGPSSISQSSYVNNNQPFWPPPPPLNPYPNQFYGAPNCPQPPMYWQLPGPQHQNHHPLPPMGNFMTPYPQHSHQHSMTFNPYMMQPPPPHQSSHPNDFQNFNPYQQMNNPKQQQFSPNLNRNNHHHHQQQQQQSQQTHSNIVDRRFVQNTNFIKKSF
jgi:H/ACA ribonucleoprotein complex non-core subunit NAF1